jgi:RNA 3'-terminal phosphate cyclase (ATP)
MIEIEGDTLEGGGQIIRTSICLAALADQHIHITKIRHKRPNPGLQPQHVTAAKAIATLCNAQTEGLTQGSTELIFKPNGHKSGKFKFDVGTAGSIPLVLQALMPCIAFAPDYVELEITGGTDVKWSPPIDYVRLVILPTLHLMGYELSLTVSRRGHYPKGGGNVTVSTTPPRKLRNITLTERDQLTSIEGTSHCVKLPSHVAQRQAEAAKRILANFGYSEPKVRIESYSSDHDPHIGPGSGITLVAIHSNATFIGADSLGERGKPAEQVGEEAARKLIEELSSKACLDRHMADMIIPYIAVAEGHSEISVSHITMHTLTNIHIAEKILKVKFQVNGNVGEAGRISVDGLNLTQ